MEIVKGALIALIIGIVIIVIIGSILGDDEIGIKAFWLKFEKNDEKIIGWIFIISGSITIPILMFEHALPKLYLIILWVVLISSGYIFINNKYGYLSVGFIVTISVSILIPLFVCIVYDYCVANSIIKESMIRIKDIVLSIFIPMITLMTGYLIGFINKRIDDENNKKINDKLDKIIDEINKNKQ